MKQQLPDELLEQLAYTKEESNYSGRDLVLAYLAHKNHAVTTNELITYVWQVKGQIIKRTYLYQMLYQLRKAELVEVGEPLKGVKRFQITTCGRQEARPYVKPVKK